MPFTHCRKYKIISSQFFFSHPTVYILQLQYRSCLYVTDSLLYSFSAYTLYTVHFMACILHRFLSLSNNVIINLSLAFSLLVFYNCLSLSLLPCVMSGLLFLLVLVTIYGTFSGRFCYCFCLTILLLFLHFFVSVSSCLYTS